MITTRSDLDRGRESRVEPATRRRAEALRSLMLRLARWCKRWPQEEDMEQEEVPSLSICLSIYLPNQQQTVDSFSRIK